MKKKITATSIEKLRVNDRRVNDTEIKGFHARINGCGSISYYYNYRTIDGKQVNYLLGHHGSITPIEARKLAKEGAGAVASGRDVQSERKYARAAREHAKVRLLGKFVGDRYEAFLVGRNAKTAAKIISTLRSSFLELYETPLDQITPSLIQAWRDKRLASGRKPATVNYAVATLSGVLSRAVEWGVIESHSLSKVKPIKLSNEIVRYLSEDEEERLRAALKLRDADTRSGRSSANEFRLVRRYSLYDSLEGLVYVDKLEPMIVMALNTGMRKGELFDATWEMLDLNTRVLSLSGGINKNKTVRHIYLNEEIYAVLKRWKLQGSGRGRIFPSVDGGRIDNIDKSWKNVLKRASIENFRFHDLRHHFASKLVMNSIDLNTVRELLGHKDMKTTLRYAHLAPDHKARAVEILVKNVS